MKFLRSLVNSLRPYIANRFWAMLLAQVKFRQILTAEGETLVIYRPWFGEEYILEQYRLNDDDQWEIL